MPTYDYKCDTCEHTFELFQSFSEDPLSKCTKEVCNGPGNGSVRKIFSAPGISFKGSGFYKNDSRSKSSSSSPSSTSSSSSETKSTSSDSSGTDSKTKGSSSNTSKGSSSAD
ncbi:MAG: FmdB family transcriptional regulator [Acidimicrobiaceae bacterium]|nr:FmdB family transcriptional regulator [Acidimicrobiaceae bacterium]